MKVDIPLKTKKLKPNWITSAPAHEFTASLNYHSQTNTMILLNMKSLSAWHFYSNPVLDP